MDSQSQQPREVVAWMELTRHDTQEIVLVNIGDVSALVKNKKVAGVVRGPQGQAIAGGGNHECELVLGNGMVLPIAQTYFDVFEKMTGMKHPDADDDDAIPFGRG